MEEGEGGVVRSYSTGCYGFTVQTHLCTLQLHCTSPKEVMSAHNVGQHRGRILMLIGMIR